MEDPKKPTEQQLESKSVPVNWPKEPGVAIYANNLCIQYDRNSVLLTFAQVNPPIILNRDVEEVRNETTSIDAVPVIRLAVPIHNFHTMVDIIHRHLDVIEKKRQDQG
ncbi:MAG: hypothetical protein K8R46_11350 [Pirellulales bacterium]|nr:hypothetical protein [Pirellulales bacterium]